MVKVLEGYQKKFLRGAAHNLQPTVLVGHRGLTEALIKSTDEALDAHELIKAKFIDFKEKSVKSAIAADLAAKTGSSLAGIIGHVAILYRRHPDPQKRKIILP
jgi:RNA-binding protein